MERSCHEDWPSRLTNEVSSEPTDDNATDGTHAENGSERLGDDRIRQAQENAEREAVGESRQWELREWNQQTNGEAIDEGAEQGSALIGEP